MKKLFPLVVLLFGLSVLAPASAAALLGQEPDPSVIVNAGGKEWVWASPCAFEGCWSSDQTVSQHHGFVWASGADWIAGFSDLSDVVTAFTGKCAATYFSPTFDHCDQSDLQIGAIWGLPSSFGGSQPYNSLFESFLVRGPREVPEPGALALLGAGLLGFGLARRRKTA